MRTRTARAALSVLAFLGMFLLASGSVLLAGLLVAATGAWTISVVRAELDALGVIRTRDTRFRKAP